MGTTPPRFGRCSRPDSTRLLPAVHADLSRCYRAADWPLPPRRCAAPRPEDVVWKPVRYFCPVRNFCPLLVSVFAFLARETNFGPVGAFGAGEVTAPQRGVVKPPTHCHEKRRHVLEWCVIPTTTAHHLSGPSTLWTPCWDIESRAVLRAPHCRGT